MLSLLGFLSKILLEDVGAFGKDTGLLHELEEHRHVVSLFWLVSRH